MYEKILDRFNGRIRRVAACVILCSALLGPSVVRAQTEWPGYLDPSFTATCLTNAAYNNTVRSILILNDGRIVGVGGFNTDRSCANGVFRCDANGAPDNTFTSPFTLLPDLNVVAQASGGKLLVAGAVYVDYKPYALARLNANGTLDGTFSLTQTNPTGGMLTGFAVGEDVNGRVVFAGTAYQGGYKAYVKRLNSNGTEDSSFAGGMMSGAGFGGVRALAIQPDRKIIIGGEFTTIAGVQRIGLARLNENGTLDETFQPPFVNIGLVRGLKLVDNGRLLVTGQFSTNGVSTYYLARLNPDGSMDPGFTLVNGGSFSATAMATEPGGRIIVAHNYGLSRFSPNGVLDTNYLKNATGLSVPNPLSVAVDASGRALVGAEAVSMNGLSRRGLTRLFGGEAPVPTPPSIDVQPTNATAFVGGSATFSVSASGSSPLSYHWYFGGINMGGSATVTFNNLLLSHDNTSIYCVVTNLYGRATSSIVQLRVLSAPVAPSITSQPASLTVTLPPPVTASDLTEANLRGHILHLRILGGATPFPPAGGYDVVLAAAGNSYTIPVGGAMPPSAGQWSIGPDLGIDAVLTLDSSFPGTGGPVKLALLPDGTFEMYADGVVNNQHGTYRITLPDGSAPGPTATFTVAATGTAPLTYQWLRNGQPVADGFVPASLPQITGAQSATLTIANVNAGNAGTYACVISNAAGRVTSSAATLTVSGPPAPDTVSPTLVLTSPATSVTRVTSKVVNFAGTAADAGGVAGISVQRGNGPVVPAVGTTSWTVSVSLEPGTNVLRFWAQDLAGNRSVTNSRTLVYVVTSPLTLTINGSGTVKGATNGQLLEVGKTYTLTALAGTGQAFSNWTGGLTATGTTVNIVMTESLTVTANFVPIPFIPWAGAYNGLFHEDVGGVRHGASGFVNLVLRTDGNFTASLVQGTKKYPFKGKFDLEGHFAGPVPRAGTNPVQVTLALDLHGAERVNGRVTDGSWDAVLHADRATFNTTANPASRFAGSYTLLIPGSTQAPDEPAGDGAASFAVDTAGNLKMSGSLADGSPVTQKVPIGKDGAWPLYVGLYGGRGSILGWIHISNSVPRDLGGRVSWSRPPGPTPKVHTNGFAVDSLLIGSAYVAPGTNTVFQDASTAVLTLTGGDLPADFVHSVVLLPGGKVTATGTNKLGLTVVPTTGLFSGSVTPPGAAKPIPFKGAILQKQTRGGGYFLGTSQSGRVRLEPE